MTAVAAKIMICCHNALYSSWDSCISLVAVGGLCSAVSTTQKTTCAKRVTGLMVTSAAWKSGIACCHPLMRYQHWQKAGPILSQMAAPSDGQATCHTLAWGSCVQVVQAMLSRPQVNVHPSCVGELYSLQFVLLMRLVIMLGLWYCSCISCSNVSVMFTVDCWRMIVVLLVVITITVF